MERRAAEALKSEEDVGDATYRALEQKGAEIGSSHYEGCAFLRCNLASSSFKRSRFTDCVFEHCDLSNIALPGSVFRNVQFRDCKLIGVNWANAAAVGHVSFENCVLNLSSFAGLDLRKGTLRGCLAREADFLETDLSEADCRGTDFAGARFSRTNLVKADFRGALSYSIRADSNKLKKARFSLPEATLLLYGIDIELEE